MAIQSPPAANKVKGQQGAMADTNLIYAIVDEIRTALGPAIDTAGTTEHPTVAALLADAVNLLKQPDLDAHALTPHGGSSTHPDLPAHDTLGLATQAELDQAPVMRFATANGVFAVASGTSIYMVPDATWALPNTTNDPDGTLIYRAA